MSKNSRHKEQGFVLLWMMFITMGMLTTGLLLLLYAKSSLTKMKAQLLSTNLVIFGSYSGQFSTQEALNNMALFANAEGFFGTLPSEQSQNFSGGALVFNHELVSDREKANEVTAGVILKQGSLGSLISSLADIYPSAISIVRPTAPYVKLTFDYSSSLSGGSTSDILQAYGVIDGDGNPGPNGYLVGSEVYPTPEIQTALPGSFDKMTGLLLPWNNYSTVWPTKPKDPQPACSTLAEVGCVQYDALLARHKSILEIYANNLFMNVKKANSVLASVMGQTSPYLDISILGGMVAENLDSWLQTALGAMFPPFVNNGDNPIFTYDEDEYTDYTLSNGKIEATVSKDFTFFEPKSIFQDRLNLSPNKITAIYLDNTFYRKLAKYAAIADEAVSLVYPAGSVEFLDPPLPIVDPPVPEDGFAFTRGPLFDADWPGVHQDILYPWGWPGTPDLLAEEGPAYTSNANLPGFVKYPWEFSCETGPPADIKATMTYEQFDPGYPLCLVSNTCNYISPDLDCEDSATAFPAPNAAPFPTNAMHPTYPSPNCLNATGAVSGRWEPRCYTNLTAGQEERTTDTSVICIHGQPRCYPGIAEFPTCSDSDDLTNIAPEMPQCCDYTTDAGTPTCVTYAPAVLPPTIPRPSVHNPQPNAATLIGTPKYRGSLYFPLTAAPDTRATVFHWLMDMTPMEGGSHHHNAVPLTRCQEYRTLYKTNLGVYPPCIWILVTDGIPNPVTYEGVQTMTVADAINALDNNLTLFNNMDGVSYTWYLGHKDTEYEKMVAAINEELLAGTLDPRAQTIFENYIIANPPVVIPSGADCTDWDAFKPSHTDIDDCGTYNSVTLPNYTTYAQTYDDFKSVMESNSSRIYLETEVSDASSGSIQLSDSFLGGLRNLLARVRPEVRLHM